MVLKPEMFFAWAAVLAAGAPGAAAGEAPVDLASHPGRAIYEKLCVECHGKHGEGVEDKADDPLEGNRSLDSLAGRIERTMPEDQEELCVGGDARAVAEYIYHAFYSLEARARNTPARIELARLTEPQYRNSVADLVQSFRGDLGFGKERGLKARYAGTRSFGGKKENKGNDVFERRDPGVRFDFGLKGPAVPEGKVGFPDDEFSIQWTGSILPEETGVYEFVIRTRNGVSLWVNEHEHEEGKTIDAWVAPHNEVREEQGSVFLIGGRPYPIQLDFFKYREKAASIELLWKPPHGVLESVPERCLTPDWTPESLVIATPFPADDRSVGYERGTSVSKEWLGAVMAGAVRTADYVSQHLNELARTKPDAPDRVEKLKAFAGQFVERAFRRPLAGEERNRLVDKRFADAESPEQAVRRLVLLALTSPRFLYPAISQADGSDGWNMADRMALALWDSLPDQRLRDLAAKGDLARPDRRDRRDQEAGRMVWNWRARAKMQGFFRHWLEIERADDLSKDKKVYPEFNEAVLADLRTSLSLFLEEVVWTGKSDYRQLLLADWLFLNGRLGKLYGHGEVKGGFQKVTMDPGRRTGIVTHPFLLTAFAYHNNTSPIHRGVFLTRNIVGMTLKSPPMANVFKEGKFDPSLTMREKVTEMTRDRACMACHVTINPLGFSLEHYDGIGRWRAQDQNRPVDATGDFKTDTGRTIQLTGARDVAEFAANAPSAHEAFIQQLFHHAVKQPVLAYGDGKMDELRARFEKSGFNVVELLKQIALTAAEGGESSAIAAR